MSSCEGCLYHKEPYYSKNDCYFCVRFPNFSDRFEPLEPEKPKLPEMSKYNMQTNLPDDKGYFFDYRLLWNNVCEILYYLKAKEEK